MGFRLSRLQSASQARGSRLQDKTTLQIAAPPAVGHKIGHKFCLDQMDPLTTGILSAAIGALVGALTAATYQKKANRQQNAFHLMQMVEEKLSVSRAFSPRQARQDTLAFYNGQVDSLSPAGKAYVDYLSALEFFLYASKSNLIAAAETETWVRELLSPDPDEEEFVREIRQLTGCNASFEYLMSHYNRKHLNDRKGTL